MVEAFEGNRAETTTMLPTITAFMAAHQLADVTIVADAGMISEGNKRAIEAAGLSFILKARPLAGWTGYITNLPNAGAEFVIGAYHRLFAIEASFRAAADHLVDLGLCDPAEAAPRLREVLAAVVDPRARRGVRHPLVVVLCAAVCAVAAGAQSSVAIAEWVADLPDHAATALGLGRRCPCGSTIRRVVQRLDGDRFDAAIHTWIQQLSATCTPTGRRRAVAVDGKALRGAGTAQGQQHLLAVIDHHTRVVLGQIGIDAKASEIAAFAPLLDTIDGLTAPTAGTAPLEVSSPFHWLEARRRTVGRWMSLVSV